MVLRKRGWRTKRDVARSEPIAADAPSLREARALARRFAFEATVHPYGPCFIVRDSMKRSGGDEVRTAAAGKPSLTGPTQAMEPGAEGSSDGAPAADVLVPRLPVQLRDRERYHVLGEHGRGGLGRVTRVYDRELGRDVAIKELLSCDHFNEARFLREVLITARLEHPGIVPIHEAGRWPDGTPFYSMKLVAGRPLRELVAERPVGERIGLLHHIVAVADALAYAHGRNIIHRDLKPSNIIVGEFGETIVIDWGLAKDLSDSEPPAGAGIGAGTGALPADRDLTSHGAILGTPSYMAPEQARGERVDQRADVYAIGIMLWELCASDKLPPAEPRVRHRILRRAHIDRDLATIIDKAIEPDLERRYRDAGALAADLKAFTSGLRIASRHYSLLETFAHWTRRHRALTRSAAALIASLMIAGVVFVWNISVERNHAAASEQRAETAQAAAETALAELTLNHAQLLLASDPSAAIDELAHYAGANRGRAEQIRAEAHGRGVALLRATPHSENAMWATGGADGVITSLGIDGTIVRTGRDGKSSVVARGVARSGRFAYAEHRHLLAYACDPADLCLFDVSRAAIIPIGDVWRDARVTGVAFSPAETNLAVVSRDGAVEIFDMTRPAAPMRRLVKQVEHARSVQFLDEATVVVEIVDAGFSLLHVDGQTERLSFAGVATWTVDAAQRRLALATEAGGASIFEGRSLRLAGHADLCHGAIIDLQFIAGKADLAYSCEHGTVGTWDPRLAVPNPRAQLEGSGITLHASSDGEYIVASGASGVITVIDLVTGLVASYRGHQYRIIFAAPPTREFPLVLSADVHGGVRVWPLPLRVARVAATVGSWMNHLVFDKRAGTIIATSWQSTLSTYSPSGGLQTIAGHQSSNIDLVKSWSGDTLATYGETDIVELWSSETLAPPRLIRTGHGAVSSLHFIGGQDEFLTSGHDGRLIRWTALGEATLLSQHALPINNTVFLAETAAVVYSTADGAVWRVTADRAGTTALSSGSSARRLVAHPDGHTAYVGYSNGDVVELDTRSWQHEVILRGAASVRDIVVANDGRSMGVVTNDGTLHVGTMRHDAARPMQPTWNEFRGRAQRVALAPDGLMVTTSTDGTLWLYSEVRQRWACVPLGAADLVDLAVSSDGATAAVLGRSGRIWWIDLQLARLQLGFT